MNSENAPPTAPCACDCYPSSLRLSMTRIKTWGPDSPMLHNDALKVVEYLEHLAAVESGDMASDPEYQAFVEGQLKHCRCASRYAPCDGVLAGGMCDDMQDDDEERCFFCSDVDCDNQCLESESDG